MPVDQTELITVQYPPTVLEVWESISKKADYLKVLLSNAIHNNGFTHSLSTAQHNDTSFARSPRQALDGMKCFPADYQKNVSIDN